MGRQGKKSRGAGTPTPLGGWGFRPIGWIGTITKILLKLTTGDYLHVEVRFWYEKPIKIQSIQSETFKDQYWIDILDNFPVILNLPNSNHIFWLIINKISLKLLCNCTRQLKRQFIWYDLNIGLLLSTDRYYTNTTWLERKQGSTRAEVLAMGLSYRSRRDGWGVIPYHPSAVGFGMIGLSLIGLYKTIQYNTIQYRHYKAPFPKDAKRKIQYRNTNRKIRNKYQKINKTEQCKIGKDQLIIWI